MQDYPMSTFFAERDRPVPHIRDGRTRNSTELDRDPFARTPHASAMQTANAIIAPLLVVWDYKVPDATAFAAWLSTKDILLRTSRLQGDPLLHHSKPWFVQSVSESKLYGAEVGEWLAPEPVGAEAVEHAEHLEHLAHSSALYTSLFVALSGIALAFLLYFLRRAWAPRIAATLGILYQTVKDRYYMDELVRAVAIRPSFAIARGLAAFDRVVVDGLVNLVGRTGRGLGFLSAWFDRTFVDGAVNGVGRVVRDGGGQLRRIQNGLVRSYAAMVAIGAIALLVWFLSRANF